MTKLYKLTTQDRYTRKGYSNQCKWGEGVTHSGTGKGGLCGPGYIHAYTSPLLAILLNPIHANILDPLLWECEGDVIKTDNGLKVGCVSLTTTKQVSIPNINTEDRIVFALYASMEVFKDSKFHDWANNWINGIDRSEAAAREAEAAARAAARAAAEAGRLDLDYIALRAVTRKQIDYFTGGSSVSS